MTRSYKPGPWFTPFGLVASLAMLSQPAPAAAQYTWIGGTGPAWNNSANWMPTGFPNSATATATFSGQHLGQVLIGLSQVTQSVTFNNPTGNYTINALGGQTLSGVTAITVAAGVAGPQTIDLPNISTGSLLFPAGNNLTITNNSTAAGTTLVIGPNTVIAGSGNLDLFGTGVTSISAKSIGSQSSALDVNGGTVILSNPANNYGGGTNVIAGTLMIAANGAVIPSGTGVYVNPGATLDLGNSTNSSANAVANITLSGGALKAAGATNSDYYTQQLTMTGGTVDFTNTPFTWIHVTGAGGITTNASATTSQLIGTNSGQSRIQNDTNNPLNITVAAGTTPSGIDLDAGIALSIAGQNSTFVKAGPGTMRLTGLNNTANITVSGGNLRVDDVSTNGVGTLGSGTYTMNGGVLAYGGSNATLTKNLTLTGNPIIQVLNPGVNLNYNGTMTESGGVRSLTVLGPGAGSPSSTLTLGATNNYSGGINVQGNAILAIQTISNIGQASPIGVDSVNGGLDLGTSNSRGTLLLTGTNATYSTNHTVFPAGIYPNGGAIGVQNAGTTLTWNGQIYNGTGALIKTGLGTLALTNTANSYTGGTYVEAGTLYIVGVGAAIPANTDVTVMSGATMLNNGDNNGSPLHTVTLIGGTLHCLNGAYTNLYLNRLVTDTAGGTVVFDVNAAAGHLYFTGTGAGATINGNTSWNGAINALIVNASAALADITIAPAATLACNVPLSGAFRILGGGALYLTTSANISPAKLTVTQGRLRVDDLSVTNGGSVLGLAQPGLLTLDGGTQQYTGSNASSPMPITLSPVGGAVEVSNASTTLTLAGTIGPAAGSAAGPLVKTGPGVLMLNNLANTYVGGITVSGGRLDVGDDAQLGGAAVTVNPAGTLRYTADATTARTFNLTGGSLEAPSGVTLILNAAAVNGGFLRGTGTFAVNGGTVLSGVTTASSTQVNLTARGSFVNFTNGGRMNITPPPAVPATFDLFTNQGSGAITIGQDSQVSVSDFQSYGTLTLNPGSFNGSTGNVTQLTNTGGSPLYFNGGSRTFISSVAQAANGNAGFDLHGNDAIVAGGLFVNNGFVYDSVAPGNHRIVADFGAVVKGAGFYQPLPRTINGGTFVTGNSPGRATTGAIVLGGPNDPNGGLSDYTWQINDAGPSSSFPSATGISGPTANAAKQVSGWGTLLAVAGTTPVVTSGDFRWDATPVDKLTIHLRTLIAPDDANGNPSATGGYGAVGDMTPGLMSNFDPTGSYSWRLFAYAGSYTGPTDTATLDASVILDTADFLNPHRGRFDLVLNRSAQEMDLVVTPTAVPEPGTLALVGLAGVAWVGYWRRRWLSNCPPRTPSAWPAADFRLDIVPR